MRYSALMRTSASILAAALALLVACGVGTITGVDDGGPGANDGPGTDDGGISGDGGGDAATDATWLDASPEPPTTVATFTESSGDVVNPERGFYSYVDAIGDDDLSYVRDDHGHSLAFTYVRLDDYRDSAIPGTLLTALADGFATVRSAGVKLILRFSYNFGPYPDTEPDASVTRVLEHIGQVGPIVSANQDALAVFQAGFIGAWGEWHTSTNDLTSPENKQTILAALLAAVPAERMVQLRYPPDKMGSYPTPLDIGTGFSGTDQARIGHHNDCFLSSDNDVGTYGREDATIAEEKAYIGADSRFVPVGGETCAEYSPRTDCPTALAELEMLGFSYLNHDYHPGVVSGWQEQGCYDEIRRRLGYRFVLERVIHSERVRPGGILQLTIELRNQGFAALFNARPLMIVLSNGSDRYAVELSEVDPRMFTAGELSTLTTRLRLPAAIATGDYELSLWLPDAASELRANPEYAIRLANTGTWNTDGRNIMVAALPVDADAPGDFDGDATELMVLP